MQPHSLSVSLFIIIIKPSKMDKLQKHDYMNNIEDYLEHNQIYELFEDLMKQLIVAKPDDPLEYITRVLSAPRGKIFTKFETRNCSQENFRDGYDRHWKELTCRRAGSKLQLAPRLHALTFGGGTSKRH